SLYTPSTPLYSFSIHCKLRYHQQKNHSCCCPVHTLHHCPEAEIRPRCVSHWYLQPEPSVPSFRLQFPVPFGKHTLAFHSLPDRFRSHYHKERFRQLANHPYRHSAPMCCPPYDMFLNRTF